MKLSFTTPCRFDRRTEKAMKTKTNVKAGLGGVGGGVKG
jgi:hypothetical protein